MCVCVCVFVVCQVLSLCRFVRPCWCAFLFVLVCEVLFLLLCSCGIVAMFVAI